MKKLMSRLAIIPLVLMVLLISFSGAGLGAVDLFFEDARLLDQDHIRFPQLFASPDRLWLLQQRVAREGENGGQLVLELTSSLTGESWTKAQGIGTPIPYEGASIPQVYHALPGPDNSIYLVYASDATKLVVGKAELSGNEVRWQEMAQLASDTPLVSPKLYRRPDGSFLVFAVRNDGQGLNIVYSTSRNGTSWSPIEIFETTLAAAVNINMAHGYLAGKDFVVYQSLDVTRNLTSPTNQLFMRTSSDGGQTWGAPKELTTFPDKGSTLSALRWDNARPQFSSAGDRLALVWERAFGGGQPQTALGFLDGKEAFIGDVETLPAQRGGAYAPYFFRIRNQDAVLSFSAAQNLGRVSLTIREGKEWKSRFLSPADGFAAYPTALFFRNQVHAAFHYRSTSDARIARLSYVEPDQSARPPRILSPQVSDGAKTRRSSLEFSLRGLEDPSGTAGFSFVIDRNPDTVVPAKVNTKSGTDIEAFFADQDGDYWVHARAVDGAGNWSGTSHFRFELDLTPPSPPSLVLPELDAKGYVNSNTFAFSWLAPEDPDSLKYRYSYQYLGDQPGQLESLPELSRIVASRTEASPGTTFSRNNVENGLYLVTVWSEDSVGNLSEPVWTFLRFNKFIPSTLIFNLEMEEDILGNRTLNIIGRGYASEGLVDEIILDRDKLEPYDYVYKLSGKSYAIKTDRRIEGLVFSDIDTGVYWLGLKHQKRGLTFARERLDFPGQGAVKFGDFSIEQVRVTALPDKGLRAIQVRDILLILVTLVSVGVGLLAVFRLRSVTREMKDLDLAAASLISGRPLQTNLTVGEASRMKARRLGLRFKFTFFFVTLVIAVVALVAYPLADFTQRNQRMVLAQGLKDRIEVIMESLVSGAGAVLDNPDDNILQILALTGQAKALQEATYVTITGKAGLGSTQKTGYDYVWDSSVPEWLNGDPYVISEEDAKKYPVLVKSIDPPPPVSGGTTTIKDAVSAILPALETEINTKARELLGNRPAQFDSYRDEIQTLLGNDSAQSRRRRLEIGAERNAITQQINELLRTLSYPSRSIPAFDPENFNGETRHYIFYRPVLFRTAGEDPATATYFKGMIRLGVDTDAITKSIERAQNEILQTILFFAGIAVAAGFLGGIVMASVIIIPIKRLVKGVNYIRDVPDMEVLSEYSVGIKSRDELRDLGNVIDQMAHKLGKAAASNKELMVGKEVQKKFIPLEVIGKEKGTTGSHQTEHVDIFGYYEGAKGVSGDYFSYLEYKTGMFAMIKCDVSGKGVPAALIMVQVATMFINYFSDWDNKVMERIKIQRALGIKNPSTDPNLGELVLLINDLIADMGYEGKFAAFNMCILNEKTGELTFCNAGDTLVQIYRKDKNAIEVVNLNKAPASGMFSSKVFPLSFKEDKNKLNKGDVLILVTDGVEESKFTHLNDKWEPEPVSQADIDAGYCPPDTTIGELGEEIGPERVIAIMDAIAGKTIYELTHQKNPRRDEKLTFDFRACSENVEDTIMGLMAVEKIFRLVQTPKATEDDIILVDRKVDTFLQKVFLQYRQVFIHPLADDPTSLYVKFSHLKENIQYDDLTILGVRKK